MSATTPVLEVTQHGTTLVLKICREQMREFDVVQGVKEAMLAEVQKHQPSVVVLDLRSVQLLGSIAFLAFLAVRRQPSVKRVVLTEMSNLVHELFAICRLIPTEGHAHAPFETARTVDAALE